MHWLKLEPYNFDICFKLYNLGYSPEVLSLRKWLWINV